MEYSMKSEVNWEHKYLVHLMTNHMILLRLQRKIYWLTTSLENTLNSIITITLSQFLNLSVVILLSDSIDNSFHTNSTLLKIHKQKNFLFFIHLFLAPKHNFQNRIFKKSLKNNNKENIPIKVFSRWISNFMFLFSSN